MPLSSQHAPLQAARPAKSPASSSSRRFRSSGRPRLSGMSPSRRWLEARMGAGTILGRGRWVRWYVKFPFYRECSYYQPFHHYRPFHLRACHLLLSSPPFILQGLPPYHSSPRYPRRVILSADSLISCYTAQPPNTLRLRTRLDPLTRFHRLRVPHRHAAGAIEDDFADCAE